MKVKITLNIQSPMFTSITLQLHSDVEDVQMGFCIFTFTFYHASILVAYFLVCYLDFFCTF